MLKKRRYAVCASTGSKKVVDEKSGTARGRNVAQELVVHVRSTTILCLSFGETATIHTLLQKKIVPYERCDCLKILPERVVSSRAKMNFPEANQNGEARVFNLQLHLCCYQKVIE